MEFSNRYNVGIMHDPAKNPHDNESLKERPLIHRIRFIGISTAKFLFNDADIVHPLNKYNILAVLYMDGYRKYVLKKGVLTTSFKVINVNSQWPVLASPEKWIQLFHKGGQYHNI